jgi:hypothetical protein
LDVRPLPPKKPKTSLGCNARDADFLKINAFQIKTMAQASDPQLWAKVKKKWQYGEKGGVPGQWNARKAQLAVREYKKRGGTYKTARPSRQNSLVRWTREDWGYIDEKPGNRYLPRKIRSELSAGEKKVENRRKKSATRSGKQYAKYSQTVAQYFAHPRSRTRSRTRSRF